MSPESEIALKRYILRQICFAAVGAVLAIAIRIGIALTAAAFTSPQVGEVVVSSGHEFEVIVLPLVTLFGAVVGMLIGIVSYKSG